MGSSHQRIVVCGSHDPDQAESLIAHLHRWLPNLEVVAGAQDVPVERDDVAVVVHSRDAAAAEDACRVLWTAPFDLGADTTRRPDAILVDTPAALRESAALALGLDGVRIALMPPPSPIEPLGDPDRFRSALGGVMEIGMINMSRNDDFPAHLWLLNRIRARRPGAVFFALIGDNVCTVEGSTLGESLPETSATDALAATRMLIVTGSDCSPIARAWAHWRPVLVPKVERRLAELCDLAGGGLWYSGSSPEEPAEFLLQHPQIGNVIGSQGHRWITAQEAALPERWMSLLFPEAELGHGA